MKSLIEKAERPLMIVGGGGWNAQAVRDLQTFAENMSLPVAASFRCQDMFDNHHPLYAGEMGTSISPKLAARVKDSDLLLVVGARLGEMTTQGYELINIPVPKQKLIHVHPGAEELGRVYHADIPINASMAAFTKAASKLEPIANPGFKAWFRWARSWNGCARISPMMPSSPMALAIIPHGRTASISIAPIAASWRQPMVPWAMACLQQFLPN
jgi:acetolactate synthase-1/2/3 large subunit